MDQQSRDHWWGACLGEGSMERAHALIVRFVWTLALTHRIKRMYAVAIWAQFVSRGYRASLRIHTR